MHLDVGRRLELAKALEGHRRRPRDEIDLAAQQRGDAGLGLGDGAEFRAVEVGDTAVRIGGRGPVALLVSLEPDDVVRVPARESERPGADGIAPVGVAVAFDRSGADRRGVGDQESDPERHVGLLVDVGDGEVVDDLDPVDWPQEEARGGGGRGIDVAFHRELDRLRVERRAVVELDLGAQVEDDGLVAVTELPVEGEARVHHAGAGVDHRERIVEVRLDLGVRHLPRLVRVHRARARGAPDSEVSTSGLRERARGGAGGERGSREEGAPRAQEPASGERPAAGESVGLLLEAQVCERGAVLGGPAVLPVIVIGHRHVLPVPIPRCAPSCTRGPSLVSFADHRRRQRHSA